MEAHGVQSQPIVVTTDECVHIENAMFHNFSSRAVWLDSPKVSILSSTFSDCNIGSGEGAAVYATMKSNYWLEIYMSCFASCSCIGYGQSFAAWNREIDYATDVSYVSVTRMCGPTSLGYAFMLLGGVNTVEAINSSHNNVPVVFRVGGYTENAPSIGSHCLISKCKCCAGHGGWLGLGSTGATSGTTTLSSSIFAKVTNTSNLIRVDNFHITIQKCVFTECEGKINVVRVSNVGCNFYITECAFDTMTLPLAGTFPPTIEMVTLNYQGYTAIPHIRSIRCNTVTQEKRKPLRISLVKSGFVLLVSS